MMTEPSFPPYNVGDLGQGAKRKAPAAARKPVLTYNNPAPDGSSTGLGAHFGGG